MDTAIFNNPGLTIALAMAMGMMAQALAHHLRVPGIVLLLAVGVALGPDGAGVIHPASLGPALNILTGFAVAVILFEGGINLKFRRLRRAQRSIRQLILIGGLVTVIGAATAVHFIMGWPWQTAVLFGTLVMVTGPTVINPLLKRLKVKRSVATVLEAEGVLIDALGAVVAIVALEAALSPAVGSPLVWGWHVISRLGFGAGIGAATGMVLLLFTRIRRLIPEGTENVFTLAMVLALFQCSNLILPESGIAAVTIAGIVVGNFSSYALRDLLDFKEELTVLLIGMLFVLLAADVRLVQVVDLGWPAVGVVLVLMFLVRPAAVTAGTAFSGLSWKEKGFIAWIGPRGIVAAAVASFFAAAFTEKGLPGGYELRALVFLVITVTVVFAGLTGGLMAGFLGLRRPSQVGWVILGANALARAVAKLLKEDGQEVVCIDSNADYCQAAEQDCTRVIYGNGLRTRYLLRAEIDIRRGALALTANDEVNYLFVQKVKEESKSVSLYAALKTDTTSLTVKMLHKTDTALLFARPVDIDAWSRRFAAKQVSLQIWQYAVDSQAEAVDASFLAQYSGSGLICAAVRRNNKLMPVKDDHKFKPEDDVCCFVFEPETDAVNRFLSKAGWICMDYMDKDAFTTSVCTLAE
ncbi:MAG: cation:proton antiporter [Proteobacteria bacterium]|nr:cation:proton antiporter [Pseudomonadota bacterium]MBU1389965.1 cation:proton antiporter [Pseudomonadota bacterium]MBU1544178.1 cation:proton antiporter [Pseudomonadota bacterium]MBU2481154.1 cation:proton antiporter [Pseudomonadota bacterium]